LRGAEECGAETGRQRSGSGPDQACWERARTAGCTAPESAQGLAQGSPWTWAGHSRQLCVAGLEGWLCGRRLRADHAVAGAPAKQLQL